MHFIIQIVCYVTKMFLNENKASTFLFGSSLVFRHFLVCFCVISSLIGGKCCFGILNEVSSLRQSPSKDDET